MTEIETSESRSLAGENMVKILIRLRKAVKNVLKILNECSCVTTPEDPVLFRDLQFVTSNTVNFLEGMWRDGNKVGGDMSYNSTDTYKVCAAVTWSIYSLVKFVISEPAMLKQLTDKMSSPNPWELESVFSDATRNLYCKHVTDPSGKPNCVYTKTAPKQTSTEFIYPGLILSFEFKTPSKFYQSYIPFGQISQLIRAGIENRTIPPMKGTCMLAALSYCFYEIIVASVNYYDALIVILKADRGSSADLSSENKMSFLNSEMSKGGKRWIDLLMRGHLECSERSANYILSLEQGVKTTDILGGISADDLKEPGSIGKVIERLTGFGGIDADFLSKIPGLDTLISGFTESSAPAA